MAAKKHALSTAHQSSRASGGGSALPNLARWVEAGGFVGIGHNDGQYVLSAVLPVGGGEPWNTALVYGSLDDVVGDLDAFAAECGRHLLTGPNAPRAKGAGAKRAGTSGEAGGKSGAAVGAATTEKAGAKPAKRAGAKAGPAGPKTAKKAGAKAAGDAGPETAKRAGAKASGRPRR